MKLLFIGRRFQGMSSNDKYNQVQLMTMSAIDFSSMFETDVSKHHVSLRHHRTFSACARPAPPTSLHHYMGEIDGAFRAGLRARGTGAISNAIADAPAKPAPRFARRLPSPKSL